jgi:2',3'-cyclic-nucleotide 2'-phosphodiesterase (5'-nucleotidase family)
LHGVDLLLGGHDHLYYVSKGVTAWEDFDVTKTVLGAEGDLGDVLVIKSGTDFRDLSEFTLELDDTPSMSVRRKVIKGIRGGSGPFVLSHVMKYLPRQETHDETKLQVF